jgi:hypothetical protein
MFEPTTTRYQQSEAACFRGGSVRELRPQIQQQLDHGLKSLSAEFGSEVAPDAIHRAGRQRLRDFLAGARIDDFIPVLVYRNVRERIIERRQEQNRPLGVTRNG